MTLPMPRAHSPKELIDVATTTEERAGIMNAWFLFKYGFKMNDDIASIYDNSPELLETARRQAGFIK